MNSNKKIKSVRNFPVEKQTYSENMFLQKLTCDIRDRTVMIDNLPIPCCIVGKIPYITSPGNSRLKVHYAFYNQLCITFINAI